MFIMSTMWQAGMDEVCLAVSSARFKLWKLYTNVPGPEMAIVDAITIGDDPRNLLLQPIDMWMFSAINIDDQRRKFMERHGLIGKTEDEIDEYLDEKELSMPSVPPLIMPIAKKGDVFRFKGKTRHDYSISLMGRTQG